MISAEEKAAIPKSVGRAMVGFEVDIVDTAGNRVADGENGEFVIRGDAVAKGYYRQPEIEAETYANVARVTLDALTAYAEDVRASRQIKGGVPVK